jgi:beta-N-acetylhexosaminidase
VQPDNISSYSFADLNDYLDAGAEPSAADHTHHPTLSTAAATSEAAGTPSHSHCRRLPGAGGAARRRLAGLRPAQRRADRRQGRLQAPQPLAQRPDLASQSKVVVLAFDAPYFLDSTEISKLSAYYGIYSRTGALCRCRRALFLESPLLGAASQCRGIQYDLFTQTQPAPQRIIELFWSSAEEIEPPHAGAAASAIGDTLRLQTA